MLNSIKKTLRRSVSVARYVWTHPANAGSRFRSVARAIQFQLQGRLGKTTAQARVGNHMLIDAPLHAAAASKAIYANPPDWAEMRAWRHLLRTGDLFVDVGSNVGLYSIWAADCGAAPIAIEPDPVNAERTRQNLALNGLVGEVHECALAAEPGVAQFSTGLDTVNHLVSSPDGAELSREVEVRTLDDILAGRHVRGIKIDVEGAERLVLEGARATLAERRVDVFQLEWNAMSRSTLGESREPVQRILESASYVLCRPRPNGESFVVTDSPDEGEDVFAVSPEMSQELFGRG